MSVENKPELTSHAVKERSPPLNPLQRAERIANWMRLFVAPGQVLELRALGVQRRNERPHTESGFFDFDHLLEFVKCADQLSPFAKGVYFTLNPLNAALLARRANRVTYAEEGQLAKDKDVLERRWLLVDIDPVRDAHISATDSERAAAADGVERVYERLSSSGWPAPIVADSGNGFHLYYPIELPAADDREVERVLESLANQFDTSAAKVDRAVFNPSRICKVPGTAARKGDSTKDRPHRMSRIIEVPSS